MPAATSHSQQPPSHQMSKAPMAVYARSSVALNHPSASISVLGTQLCTEHDSSTMRSDLPAQTSDAVHHATFPATSANLYRHINEALDLAAQVSPFPFLRVRIPSVLAPLAAENTPLGGIGRDGHRFDQGQALRLVEPGALALA